MKVYYYLFLMILYKRQGFGSVIRLAALVGDLQMERQIRSVINSRHDETGERALQLRDYNEIRGNDQLYLTRNAENLDVNLCLIAVSGIGGEISQCPALSFF